MDISRREFVGALTGLAAVVRATSASAFEYNEQGYNNLIPAYGEENLVSSIFAGLGDIGGAPRGFKTYKIRGNVELSKLYVGKDMYAISITTGEKSSSFILYDDKGDGVFRKKYAPGEKIPIPLWILSKYVKTKT